MTNLLNELAAIRSQLAEIDRAEHPDITDRFGRVWVWRSGDFYAHDDALCFPWYWITSTEHPINLPSSTLADNPNYRLCKICTQDWPEQGE